MNIWNYTIGDICTLAMPSSIQIKNLLLLIFQYEVAVITKDGAVIEPATSVDTNWDIAAVVEYVQTSFFLDHSRHRG